MLLIITYQRYTLYPRISQINVGYGFRPVCSAWHDQRGSAWVSRLGEGLQTPPRYDRRSQDFLFALIEHLPNNSKTQMETCGHPGDKVRDLVTTHSARRGFRGSAWVSRPCRGMTEGLSEETCGHPGDKVRDLVTTDFDLVTTDFDLVTTDFGDSPNQTAQCQSHCKSHNSTSQSVEPFNQNPADEKRQSSGFFTNPFRTGLSCK